MNLLITGGNGYIGSRLVLRAQQERWKLTLLDSTFDHPCEQIDSSLRLVGINAADPMCERIFADSRYDVVVHLACKLLPEQSDLSIRTLHDNICSLENILYLSLVSRVSKVIVLLDWQIYGHYENQNRKTESSELKPESETGRQEQLRDKLCEAYRRQGLDVAVLRTGLVYGPSKTKCPDPRALQHQALPVSVEKPAFGYDFIHINDLTEAIIRVCQLPTSPVINLGSGQLASMEQFKRIYESSVVGKQSLSENCSLNEKQCLHNIQCTQKTSRDELGRFTYSCCLDHSLASFELDWSPRYTLETGVVLNKKFLPKKNQSIVQQPNRQTNG